VLVVDDDEGILELETDVLQGEGYSVEQAAGGAAAIEQLKRARPDLVLLDLLMPGIDGWGVLRFVRGMANPPRVVVVSGLREIVPPGDLSQCVAGSVHKPFAIEYLIKTCASVLAAPELLSPASGNRRDPRRTFVVETTLLSTNGTPLALGQLLEVSKHGFRLELAIALKPGDPVHVALQIPGRDEPLQLSGRVRWRREFIMGAEADGLNAQDEQLLRQLLGSNGVSETGSEPPRDLKSS
jgi:CheY-like chemotaxis protein